MSPAPLRRRPADLLATAALTTLAAVTVGGAWFTAPVRSAHLDTAEESSLQQPGMTTIPEQLSEVFSAEATALPGVYQPVVDAGLVFTHDTHTVRALDDTGQQRWSYSREDREICSLGQAWDKVVVTYRSGVGCGDVVALRSSDGRYAGTRSSVNDEQPFQLASNDRVGIVGPTRLDLWRSDLVRTVEYGGVEAKQEPGLQPHQDCEITSALTRTELLAVAEICPETPENQGHATLRLMDATPEESRTPEIHASVELPSPGARLVAVGQDSAAVYSPGETTELVAFDRKGKELSRSAISPSPLLDDPEGVFVPPMADLPHHMTWFDGSRLYLLKPDTLEVTSVIEGVLGTGVDVGERALVPVPEGIAVVDWVTGQTERVIPVDRAGYQGPVHLATTGDILVESRGETLIGLGADGQRP